MPGGPAQALSVRRLQTRGSALETAGVVQVTRDRIVVRFDKRSHNPLLREATMGNSGQAVSWLHNRPLFFEFP